MALGKTANKVNGNARPVATPPITKAGANIDPEEIACTNAVPTIGPVHEKETRTSVNAMKKIPIKPPLSALESALLTHEEGIFISKAPKNENANRMKMAKNIKFNKALVENS